MPIYEYECSACSDRFEVWQGINDPPVTSHDGCGAPVRRLISLSSFALKGTGWYVTDYARKERGSSEKEGKKKEEGSSGEGASCARDDSASGGCGAGA